MGAVYDSREFRPEELPPGGMVGAVEFLEPHPAWEHWYRRLVDGGNWYRWREGRWEALGDGRDDGEWGERPEGEVVIRSAPSLPDELWKKVKAEMVADRRW